MILKKFKVLNYRSIDNSEPVEVERMTVLMGRNESGKSNLLRALYYLNPSDGKSLPDEDYDLPHYKKKVTNPPFIRSVWELDEEECKEIAKTCPQISYPCEVVFGRKYDGEQDFSFCKLPSVISSHDEANVQKISPNLLSDLYKLTENLDQEDKLSFEESLKQFEAEFDLERFNSGYYAEWANSFLIGFEIFRTSAIKKGLMPTKTTNDRLKEIMRIANTVKTTAEKIEKGRVLAWEKIPTFIYIHEYPKIFGEYKLSEFLSRRGEGEQTSKDVSLEKLFKVAEIDPEKLRDVSPRKRKIITDVGDRKLTARINELWCNTQLDISIDIDGDDIHVHIKSWEDDMTQKRGKHRKGGASRKEGPPGIHLDQQSAGFRWFFNFYVTFAAETDFGNTKNRILLLDEPGLHLHAQSQYDLVQYFKTGFNNQILYTTHSPFMIPEQLGEIRLVSLGDDGTTKVKGNFEGNQELFFPDELALGLSLEQSKRMAPYILIVEGATDVWILKTVSAYLRKKNKGGIRRSMAIKASHGAAKVKLFTSGLFSEKVGVMVLLDNEKSARDTIEELKFLHLVQEKNCITVVEAFGRDFHKDADIEDILGDKIYGRLVRLSHEEFATREEKDKEVVNKLLTKKPRTPRIVHHYQDVFEELGLEFHKAAPIKIFCKLMLDPQEASVLINEKVEKRFAKLFKRINQIKDEEVYEEDKKSKSNKVGKGTRGDEGGAGGAGGEA